LGFLAFIVVVLLLVVTVMMVVAMIAIIVKHNINRIRRNAHAFISRVALQQSIQQRELRPPITINQD